MKSAPNNPIPLLPLRELVVFPQQVVPLFVGREKSVKAIEESQREGKYILLAAQKDARTSNPGPKDIYTIGTLGEVVQLIRLADGPIKVLVEGKVRDRAEGAHALGQHDLRQLRQARQEGKSRDDHAGERDRGSVTPR